MTSQPDTVTEASGPPPAGQRKPPRKKVVAAWAVHAFTGTGMVLAMLALVAVLRGDQTKAFLWLGLALFVDGIDGSLARKFRVSEFTPRFDGAALDLVIDFVTYAFIPALMVFWFPMVPAGWGVVAACYIAATSLYCFANLDMKTADYYFAGFPAVWNLVVLYMFILRTPFVVNLVIIGILGVLTFVPWKYVHPLRVVQFRPLTLAMTVIWSTMTLWLVFIGEKPEHPMFAEPLVFWIWVGTSVYFFAICAVRSIEDGREDDDDDGAAAEPQ